jgi:proline iminopeptidase
MKYVIRLLSILLLFAIALTACQNKNSKAKNQVLNEVKSEGIITVDGIDLHYKIEGTGKPILVLNGSLFPPILSNRLREHCQLIFVDTRCFIPIETPLNLASWTIETYADDIETIRKALKLEKVGVLGHSAFGFLPLEYAIKYTDNISYAIVIGTPPFLYNNKYAEEAEKYWETQASEERKIAFQKSVKELEVKSNSGTERTPTQIWVDNYISLTPKFWYDWNYDATWIFENANFNMDVVNDYYGKIMQEYDPSSRYVEIKCPVFIANGKYDFWAVPTLWAPVVSKLGNFSNNIFEKSSHWAMFEEQELFDSKLLKWIAENEEL